MDPELLFTVLKLLNQRPYIVVISRRAPSQQAICARRLKLDSFTSSGCFFTPVITPIYWFLGPFGPLHCVLTRCNRIKPQALNPLNSTSVLIQSFCQAWLQQVVGRFDFLLRSLPAGSHWFKIFFHGESQMCSDCLRYWVFKCMYLSRPEQKEQTETAWFEGL